MEEKKTLRFEITDPLFLGPLTFLAKKDGGEEVIFSLDPSSGRNISIIEVVDGKFVFEIYGILDARRGLVEGDVIFDTIDRDKNNIQLNVSFPSYISIKLPGDSPA